MKVVSASAINIFKLRFLLLSSLPLYFTLTYQGPSLYHNGALNYEVENTTINCRRIAGFNLTTEPRDLGIVTDCHSGLRLKLIFPALGLDTMLRL